MFLQGNTMPLLKRIALLCILLMAGYVSAAQLQADFAPDPKSGCSPLTVTFTNTTKGASPNATYQWNLGNGSPVVTDINPSAVYFLEQKYIVTLTVKDGSNTSIKTDTITVYKKPSVKFTASPVKGCAPLEVTFASTSTAGDGTITNYFWDFGDGFIDQGSSLQQVKHKYTIAQKPVVKLQVTNSYGCFKTLDTVPIEITQGIRINFAADKTQLCAVPGTVNFTNTSTGPGTLSYQWDFGDNQSSTAAAPPPHAYTKKGLYTVKLKVSSNEGCSDSLVKTGYINAANFTSAFDVPDPLCGQAYANYVNKSQPLPVSSLWKFSDDNSSVNSFNAFHYYSNPGTYTVTLINTYGSCFDTLAKTITVNARPNMGGYLNDKDGDCKAPLTVKFEDTSKGDVKWYWYFGTGFAKDTSNLQKPVFTFTQNNRIYYVNLTVTNSSGCASTVTKQIRITRPDVSINYVSSTSPNGTYGCTGMKIKFRSYPVGEVETYKWDFGDGGTSTDSVPEHTFNKEGLFAVKLKYKTKSGCEDSAYYYYVRTYKKPKADFTSLSGLTICGNTPVSFRDLTDTSNSWYWDFGDGSTSFLRNPVHAYGGPGDYVVTLIASNQYCSDTIRKSESIIKVSPPFTNIQFYVPTCSGTRGNVSFYQSGSGAKKWTWNFGDGTTATYTTNVSPVAHTYTKSGIYKVFLVSSNDTCSSLDSVVISVLLKQKPVITADKNNLCGSDTVKFRVTGLDSILYYSTFYNQTYAYHYTGRWVYSDGTVHSYTNNFYPPVYEQSLTHIRPAKDSIRLIVYNPLSGCYDTSNYVSFNISGPVAGYRVSNSNVCYSKPVSFIDTSKGTNGVAISKWIWDFGDGVKDTLTGQGSVLHKYSAPGAYYPKLKVIDANGCFAETYQFLNYINVNGPQAGFYANDTVVSPGTAVQFYNTSNAWPYYITNYTWNFGDNTTSAETAPAHSYAASGIYTVTLIAKNSAGCADTITKPLYIRVRAVKADFTLTSSYVNGNNCPPLLAKFVNTSLNADSIFWDFGDNSFSGNVGTPGHTYYQPGVYKVTLYAFGKGGEVDTAYKEVIVNGPYGTVKADVFASCAPRAVTLNAEAKNTVKFTWDFNDGYVTVSTDTFSVHTYTNPGVYLPKVIMRDAGGCTSTFQVQDSIIVDSLKAAFTAGKHFICDSGWVNFNTSVQSFAADSLNRNLVYRWNFGTGNVKDTSDQKNPSFNFTRLGKYTVTLTVISPFGCSKTLTDTILVTAKPKAAINAVGSICVNSNVLFSDAGPHQAGESWTWNFGDGRVSAIENPQPVLYNRKGKYNISLVKNSENGCSDTSSHILVVDSLAANFKVSQYILCDSGIISFTPQVISFARDSLSAALRYHWDFGTGNPKDSTAVEKPGFNFNRKGKYKINMNVVSPYGCEAKYIDSIQVLQRPKASISSINEICAGQTIQFTGTVDENTGAIWNWSFGNGNVSSQQNPPVQSYADSGSFNVRLVAYNNPSCPDTINKLIRVHPNPVIALSPKDPKICRGDSVQLFANGGDRYQWLPATGLSNSNIANPFVSALQTTLYKVTVTNNFGCLSRDSVTVFVSQPFDVDVTDDAFICYGSSLQLNASGAISYKWIQGGGLNSTSVANPVAGPAVTTVYKVVGYGNDDCFTDTASVKVEVIPLPVINAGRDTTLLVGSVIPLLTQASSDVTGYQWSPSTYLSCSNCSAPVSAPKDNITYTVTARNSFGCKTSDTVKIQLQCSSSVVFIPNSFTPNNDGVNDIFYPRGRGIRNIKYFRIYNRWGELIFERSNFNIDDKSAGWDGTFKGEKLATGVFVYSTEMLCDNNEPFSLKGTIMIIR
ncbi:MAG: PKD domain-containing protein [Chitinophagaceae bacterium]|nr:PKD domain-containing protein [Chitinophagaceae bacterium]